MARAVWSGSISFGLLNIPVEVYSTKEEDHLSFRMLDKRDHSPIGYRQYNKVTGKEVPRQNIVKAFEYDKNQFVVMDESDFKKANPKATRTIDIEDFVKLDNLDFMLFEKPYYLVPGKNGEKGYVLLQKVLKNAGRVAMGTIVMRNRQRLVAIMAQDSVLVLEILRFAHEVKELHESRLLDEKKLEKIKISAKEMKMAQELVAGMTEEWDPSHYKDTYQDDLMKLIKAKVKRGQSVVLEVPKEPSPTNTNVVDLTALLRKSLTQSGSINRKGKSENRASR